MCCQRWRIHVIYWLFSFDYMPWTLFSHSLLLCVFFFSGSKSAFCWDHIKTYIWTSRINIDLLSVVNDPSNQMQITSQILALTLCSLEKKKLLFISTSGFDHVVPSTIHNIQHPKRSKFAENIFDVVFRVNK